MASGITVITYAYPPMKFPRAIQIARLIKHLNCKATIICANDDVRTDDSIYPELVNNGKSIVRVNRSLISRYLNKILLFCLPEIAPDEFWLWQKSAVRYLLKNRKLNNNELLITFGQPMTDHLAALALKKKYPDIKWIAHFSDPWADNPYLPRNQRYRKALCKFEKMVISQADLLIFTNQETLDIVTSKYDIACATKAAVLPHSYDPESYGETPQSNSDHITLRYLGNFYGNRTPRVIFSALKSLMNESPVLDNVSIEIIGDISRKLKLQLLGTNIPENLVRFLPAVSYKESIELMSTSDGLLLIDAPAKKNLFLPSKLIDYLGSNRPVLGITPPGASRDLVLATGGLCANPDDTDGIKEVFREFIERIKSGRGEDMVKNRELRNEYSVQKVSEKFKQYIERVMK